MSDVADNLLGPLPAMSGQEHHHSLVAAPHVRIERIVSPPGHADAPDAWYDQDWDEWVTVLAGSAGLRFADEPGPRLLQAGDHVMIAAHRRHRVAWTDPGQPTVWLAVHYR